MGLFDGLFGSDTSPDVPQESHVPNHEHFPSDEYGPVYSLAVYREDLEALKELLETESSQPTVVEQSAFLPDAVDDEFKIRTSGEELQPFINDLIETWEQQMDIDPSAVWWPVASGWRFQSYLTYCEVRDDQEEDAFEFPSSIGRVHALFSRCQAAQENDANLAIVSLDEIPGEEPTEEENQI